MKKKKLTLNKRSIAKLNDQTLKDILGGDDEAFTSIFHCSVGGWTCASTCTANPTYTCICTNPTLTGSGSVPKWLSWKVEIRRYIVRYANGGFLWINNELPQFVNMRQDIENTFQKIHQLILSTPANNDSFFSGNQGLAYYHSVLYQALGNEADKETAVSLMEQVVERFNNDSCNIFSPNYGGGAAGFGFVMNALNADLELGLNMEDELEDLDEYLFDAAFRQLKEDNTDCLHGMFGIVHYFATRGPGKYLDTLILEVCNHAKRTPHGIWFENILESDEKSRGVINLSLSHGLVGMLLILLNTIPVTIHSEAVKTILREGIRLLLYYRQHTDFITGDYSAFPATISLKEDVVDRRVRLAWCYGDLGPVLLCYRAARILEDPGLKQLADSIGTKTLLRRDDIATWVSDPYFCHGSAGLAIFYKVLQQESGLLQYQDGIDYWTEKTISFVKDITNQKDYYKNRHGLLDGLVGVNLSLLSYLSDKDLKWNNAFFL